MLDWKIEKDCIQCFLGIKPHLNNYLSLHYYYYL